MKALVKGGGNAGLDLPDELSEISDDLRDYSQLWYGREKIGKTSLLAEFPDTLLLMCEPGAKALRVYKRDVRDWREFVKYVDLLEENPKRFKTIGIDTVDQLAKMCDDYTNQKLAIQHVSDAEWGKAYSMRRDELAKQVSRLLKLGRGVVFTSHAFEKEIKARNGTSYERIEPSMPKFAREVLEPMVDIWAYLAYDVDGNRTMDIRGNDQVAAGHRLQEHFTGIEAIPMGKSAKEAYENFVGAFNNKLPSKPQPTSKFRIPKGR